jgi:RNAse (barnase) inhibitor barstar
VSSADAFEFDAHIDQRYVRLPITPSLSSTEALFEAYENAFSFPEYFGRNWNAFIDLMSDLSWIDSDEVAVVHEGLPALRESELRTYLECLQDVLSRARPTDRPQVRVGFRSADREHIRRLLDGTE